jgi:AraC family transcriptional regulator of adaptative response / DNA-3-methyladenine glycosylase II
MTTVKRAVDLIHAGELVDQSLASFAERLGVSDRQLRRLFDAHVGVSPQAYALNHRLLFAKQLLTETRLPVIDVALASGFQSRRRFNDAFQRQFALTPSRLRKPHTANQAGFDVRLRYRPPFDFRTMLRFLQARTLTGVETVEGESYSRSFTWERARGWFSLTHDRTDSALLATIHCPEPRAFLPIVKRIRQVFDLDASPSEISRALSKDARLKPRLKRVTGLRLPGIWSEFEAVVRAIVGQQISVQAARTILSRLCERFGEPLPDAPTLRSTFPSPQVLAQADLSGVGLTKTRAGWLGGVAQAYADGFCAGEGDLDSRVERLCSLPGIGPWSAHYICIRALQESDAFPASDLGLYKALGLDKGTPKQTEAIAEAWRPWRAYAALCLWHSLGD